MSPSNAYLENQIRDLRQQREKDLERASILRHEMAVVVQSHENKFYWMRGMLWTVGVLAGLVVPGLTILNIYLTFRSR